MRVSPWIGMFVSIWISGSVFSQARQDHLAISPGSPTTGDAIVFSVSGSRPTSQIVVDGVNVSVAGTAITVLTSLYVEHFAVPGGFSATASIPPLQQGRYNVSYFVRESGNPGQYGAPWLAQTLTLDVAGAGAATVQVIEYFNDTLGHYFITADPVEAQTLLDRAQPGWSPTGQVFNALSAGRPVPVGAASVCRFYGSTAPGPNSHFYTLFADECAALKALQQSMPASLPRWNYEGIAFAATSPLADGSCPTAAPLPVRRFYNQRAAQNDSNHRFIANPALAEEMRTKGWRDEGTVMCAARSP